MPSRGVRAWLVSSLFRVYLGRFVMVWIAAKTANAAWAFFLRMPPFGFRPATELVACAAELLVLWLFLRRDNEDILLGNLGWPMHLVFAPLVLVHFVLSAGLAFITR